MSINQIEGKQMARDRETGQLMRIVVGLKLFVVPRKETKDVHMYEEHIFGVLKKNDYLTEYSLDSVVRHEDNVPGIETMDIR